MKKPNFFIIGAPKCGTTSLADWLRDHQNVFMSIPKEPNFFNSDSKHGEITSLSEYENIFLNAQPDQHIAVGEASVWYLISDVAVDNILKYNPNARVIVCIRNPVDATVSLHDHLKVALEENIKDFVEAWRAQQDRKSGRAGLPIGCKEVTHLLYGENYLFGKHLKKLLAKVSHQNVLVISLDEMKKEPRDTYLSVLNFLCVDDDGRTVFPVSNPSKKRKWIYLNAILLRLGLLKSKMGVKWNFGVERFVKKKSLQVRKRPQINQETKKMLQKYFSKDIKECSKLISNDLSGWLTDYKND